MSTQPGASTPAERFPQWATSWRLRTRTLSFTTMPLVMGIVNVTPDSFSDGGRFLAFEAAVAQARQLVQEGADVLDIGGESTRPYAQPVSAEEESRRVLPVIEALAAELAVPLSIDTTKASVARAAIGAGAEIINDVTGLTADPGMIALAAETGAGVCAMHMQGTPQTMQDDPQYVDVVTDVLAYLQRRQAALIAAGIAPERISLDPGIGFGKTHQHNLTLLANCHRFHALGSPLFLGPSRKGFIAKVLKHHRLGDSETDRDAGTVGVALSLATQGVQVLRVHNVAAVKQALALFTATGGASDGALCLP